MSIITRIFSICLLLQMAGCAMMPADQGDKVVRQRGLITNTVGEWGDDGNYKTDTKNNIYPAFILEVDGKRLSRYQKSQWLDAGTHEITVWPRNTNIPIAWETIPDYEEIHRRNIEMQKMTLNVQPGYRYFIGVKVVDAVTKSTINRADYFEGKAKRYMVPVVVKKREPIDLVEVAKGAAAFLGAMAVVPLALLL